MANRTSGKTIENGNAADITGIVSAAVLERGQRQEARYKLRSSLRQVTKVKRLRYCGLPFEGDMIVRCKDGVHHFAGMRRNKEDPYHFTGMTTCGSAWICPVCASKVRHHRADEVSRAVVSALDKGYSALFVTSTLPHSADDRLRVTLNLLAEGRRYMANQPVVKALRREAGYLGSITGKEITYSFNGWHPHTHQVEFYEHEMTLASFAALSSAYYDYFSRFYSRNGFDGLSRQHGIKVERVELRDEVLARYVAKLQEGASFRLHTAHELTRSDLKQGRAGSLMPFDLASQYFGTGNKAMLELWYEFEEESKGKSALRFTEGLRALLLPNEAEQSDKKLADLKIGGRNAVLFAGSFYRKIAKIPDLEGKVLNTLDTGGFEALVELLTLYHLEDQIGYWQLEGESKESV